MNKKYKYLIPSFLALFLHIISFLDSAGNPPIKTIAGNHPLVKWTVKNPLEQKVFIENKGQYEIKNKVNANEILYGAQVGYLLYYFTANSIWIKIKKSEKRTKQEIEQAEQKMNEENISKHDDNDEKELEYKIVNEFHEMSFIGVNPGATLIADSEVSWDYNFAISNKVAVRAQAWKRITYKNLYPGIDMELYFPKDKQGFEYSFIVHPGADVSQIKIQYPLSKGIRLTYEGNVSIQSAYGEFIDHAPIATQGEASKVIDCRFIIGKSSVVQFNTGSYDNTKTLLIDPWTATPVFSGENNCAFSLDWDNAGNCYVLGGYYPFQVSKYNNVGNLVWVDNYTDSYSGYWAFGDITVDKKSQSVYVSEGGSDSSIGARIFKFNSAGSLVKAGAANVNNDELWRINYSSTANLLVLGGSGTIRPYGELYTIDTNLTPSSFTQIDAFGYGSFQNIRYQDIWGITFDNYGNCYAGIVGHGGLPQGNLIVKCPLSSLTPTLWEVNDSSNFQEQGIGYYLIYTIPFSPYLTFGNVYNGMACSCANLFTWDSHNLRKWSLDSGKLLSQIEVIDTSVVIGGVKSFLWGGLSSDDYGNLFLGVNDSIKQYNGSLQLINTLDPGSSGNPIFDVGLNLNDRSTLYVCGLNFLSAVTVSTPLPPDNGKAKVEVTQPISCINPYGSATVDTPSVLSPGDITWNTTPEQFGYTGVDLPLGTYVVTINRGSCEGVIYDTITIKISGNEKIDTVPDCQGHPVTLNGKPGESNYEWTPSTGLSSSKGSSVTATPGTTVTYTVTSILNGCTDTVQFNVVVNPGPVINVMPQSSLLCSGEGDNTFTATGAVSYQWNPSSGLNETTGAVVTANPSISTTYTVSGIDSTTGCSSITTFNVNVGTQPKASFTVSLVDCQPQMIQFVNNSTNGNSCVWNFGDDSTSTEMNPEHMYGKAGTYTITLVVTAVPGCVDSTSITESVQSGNDNVYMPNAFTPGQVNNNYFFPNVECFDASSYEFRVYNRWGELVYESTDPDKQGWDGTYKGVSEPQDTYVYYVELTCNGCKTFKKGDVTLLR